MLSELSIRNFAIIESLLVRFDCGFTALTGETGAGKSIIIDALHAALGARTGSDVVRGDARVAEVEAIFDGAGEAQRSQIQALLTENGIDLEDEDVLILRREVSAAGRGSARINGRAVPLSVLVSIGRLLVDIHGQTDHLNILRRDQQLEVLDRYGGLEPLASRVAQVVKEFGRISRALRDEQSGQREAARRVDLLRFQIAEIEAADLAVDEEAALGTERNLLMNAEHLAQSSSQGYEALQGESGAALDGLLRSIDALSGVRGIDIALDALAERLETARIEIEDVAQELRRYRDTTDFDPQRLAQIEDRLDLIGRLKRKYGSSIEEILSFQAEAQRDLAEVENVDERIAELTRQVTETEGLAISLAEELSMERRRVARDLADDMAQALQGLGLKGTLFEVQIRQVPASDGLLLSSGERCAFSQTGIDQIAFLVSFNPGEQLRPLDKVASGGETSRFLLALKSVLAEADRTPTLIFDEVDVGVGGRAGTDVGERMRQLSQSHQVISITHLPQIAALADQHVTVSKVVSGGRTSVKVRPLEGAERIVEIAQMMSGSGTEAARRNAQELLDAAHRAG